MGDGAFVVTAYHSTNAVDRGIVAGILLWLGVACLLPFVADNAISSGGVGQLDARHGIGGYLEDDVVMHMSKA